MNFKSWLKEEKGSGGFGAFLIIIIIAASIYAVQFGPSNLLYDPEPDFTAVAYDSSEGMDVIDNREYSESTYTSHNNPTDSNVMPEIDFRDSLASPRFETPEPRNESRAVSAKEKKSSVNRTTYAKPKVKIKRKRLSNEELIKRKLAQGKTVRQIAAETGLERRYIREVKRRTQQVIW